MNPDNPVAQHFWGKVRLEGATAFYRFDKGEKVQQLIHHLKYKGRTDAGILAGELFGKELLRSIPFCNVEMIAPVPLHAARKRERGYNQSDAIAEGLSSIMKVPFIPDALVRNTRTSTQTKKHRYERFENMNRVFEVREPKLVEGRHVLLVDDVITTGSTLIACAESLLEIRNCRVSVACLASA